MDRAFICHYHEIALKRGNRLFFETQLARNIRSALAGLPLRAVRRRRGHLVVELTEESPVEMIGRRLQDVAGIVYCSPAWVCPAREPELKERLWSLVLELTFDTFKIQARRSNKAFPLNSQQLNERLGAHVLAQSGKKVRLDDPDLTCHVEIVEGDLAYLYFEKLPAIGGLPVSTAGKVVVLLSGGIDSPVAAFRMIKRGCKAIFVHFHSFPHTTLESQDKVRRLVDQLNRYQYSSKLYLIPFAECQRQIVARTPPETRVILYRRMMVRLAERVARREKALALVTGDSLGQVASQTLENIQAVSEAGTLSILRPLIGDDKEEIIRLAKQIGTFETSIIPDQDCCSLFVPRHPETRANLAGLQRLEQQLDLEAMMEDALHRTEFEKSGGRSALETAV